MSQQSRHDPAVLPRIRELRAEGRSLREIAAILQDEGVPPLRRGGRWNHKAVERLLARAGGRTPIEEASPPAAGSALEPGGPPSLHIALDGPCTPADRRLWFSLVRVTRPELGHKPRHGLPRAHALALLAPGPATPGPADLWGAMKRLRASGITWEARFDGLPLLITTPLISGVLTTTALTFHFSPELVTLLLDDTQFARLRALLGREHDLPPATR